MEKRIKRRCKRKNRSHPKRNGRHANNGRSKRLGEMRAAESSLERSISSGRGVLEEKVKN